MRDLRALDAAHPGGQRKEEWREAGRVDSDEERHEGGKRLVEHPSLADLRWTALQPCATNARVQDDGVMRASARAESQKAAGACPICGGDGIRAGAEGPHGAEREVAALRGLRLAGAAPHLPPHVRAARAGDVREMVGDPVQPGPDARSGAGSRRSSFPSSASRAAWTSRRSTGRTAPTTMSAARTSWSMWRTTAGRSFELLRITAPDGLRLPRRPRSVSRGEDARLGFCQAGKARAFSRLWRGCRGALRAIYTAADGRRLFRGGPGDWRARRRFPAAEIGSHGCTWVLERLASAAWLFSGPDARLASQIERTRLRS